MLASSVATSPSRCRTAMRAHRHRLVCRILDPRDAAVLRTVAHGPQEETRPAELRCGDLGEQCGGGDWVFAQHVPFVPRSVVPSYNRLTRQPMAVGAPPRLHRPLG